MHALTERGPIALEAKVRSLQVHSQPTNEVIGGQRAAICLAGIERQDVERGATIATPGVLRATQEVDVKLYHVKHTKKPLLDRADAKRPPRSIGPTMHARRSFLRVWTRIWARSGHATAC